MNFNRKIKISCKYMNLNRNAFKIRLPMMKKIKNKY